jgi:hypothetical protein
MKYAVALDTETNLIGANGTPIPDMMTLTVARPTRQPEGYGNHPADGAEQVLEALLDDEECTLVGANMAFDMAVIAKKYPRLGRKIRNAYKAGRIVCIQALERLGELAAHGSLTQVPIPGGGVAQLEFSLAALVRKYLGRDISEDKDNPLSPRLRFAEMDGKRFQDYPPDFKRYALDDALLTLQVFNMQPRAYVQVAQHVSDTHFRLNVVAGRGLALDQAEVDHLDAEVDKVMDSTAPLLERARILRNGLEVGAPKAKDMAIAVAALLSIGIDVNEGGADPEKYDWTPHSWWLSSIGVGFKKATTKAGSINTAALQAHVAECYKALGREAPMTDGEKPRVSTSSEVLDEIVELSQVLTEYKERQELAKLKSMVPILKGQSVCYSGYKPLVETGRTSATDSGASRKASEPRMYTSIQIQNPPGELRKLNPRGVFVARPGFVLLETDFAALELGCVSHVTKKALGWSNHWDVYQSGRDFHATLGAVLATNFAGGGPVTYEELMACKKTNPEFYDKWRTFGKVYGLSLPGGVGPDTLCKMAWAQYKVRIDPKDAHASREVWRAKYPEVQEYIKSLARDEYNLDEHGDPKYVYTSPLGLRRAGCYFTAAANGSLMQSPGAEAATRALQVVEDAAYDGELQGCFPLAFVHDSILTEVPEEALAHFTPIHERLMIDGGSSVLDTIRLRVESKAMRRWNKKAKVKKDDAGNLLVWEEGQ